MWATRMPGPRSRDAAPRAQPSASGLCLYLRCHEHVLALDTRWVERLLLPDEAEAIAPGAPALVRVDGQLRAVWNLGEVWKGPAALGSLVLLDAAAFVAAGIADAPGLAFAAGPCLKVAPAPALAPLPLGIFRAKHGHVRGAFAAAAALGGVAAGASIGLALDPLALLGANERASSAQAIARQGEAPR
jgi:hypothetical protein